MSKEFNDLMDHLESIDESDASQNTAFINTPVEKEITIKQVGVTQAFYNTAVLHYAYKLTSITDLIVSTRKNENNRSTFVFRYLVNNSKEIEDVLLPTSKQQLTKDNQALLNMYYYAEQHPESKQAQIIYDMLASDSHSDIKRKIWHLIRFAGNATAFKDGLKECFSHYCKMDVLSKDTSKSATNSAYIDSYKITQPKLPEVKNEFQKELIAKLDKVLKFYTNKDGKIRSLFPDKARKDTFFKILDKTNNFALDLDFDTIFGNTTDGKRILRKANVRFLKVRNYWMSIHDIKKITATLPKTTTTHEIDIDNY